MADISLEGLTLHVADVDRSLEFYKRIPGVSVLFERPGRFALLQVGKGRLGLLNYDAGRFHVEFETSDLNAAYEELRASGLEPLSPPTDRPWGERDFLVTDPDGNVLEFGASSSSGI
ncbi:MAG TPA: VOC family protein [Isosphaeraceae bacterium]|nr:VOC family protein [Isosphaeraceae bacterium]